MGQQGKNRLPPELLKGLTESERRALMNASGGDDSDYGSGDELMDRAYRKTGIDPRQAAMMKDRNFIMAHAQGPAFVGVGALFAVLGLIRTIYAWSYSVLSIGGICTMLFGAVLLYAGLTGSILYTDENVDE